MYDELGAYYVNFVAHQHINKRYHTTDGQTDGRGRARLGRVEYSTRLIAAVGAASSSFCDQQQALTGSEHDVYMSYVFCDVLEEDALAAVALRGIVDVDDDDNNGWCSD